MPRPYKEIPRFDDIPLFADFTVWADSDTPEDRELRTYFANALRTDPNQSFTGKEIASKDGAARKFVLYPPIGAQNSSVVISLSDPVMPPYLPGIITGYLDSATIKTQGKIFDPLRDRDVSAAYRSEAGEYLNIGYKQFPNTPVFLLNDTELETLAAAVIEKHTEKRSQDITGAGTRLMRDNLEYISDPAVKAKMVQKRMDVMNRGAIPRFDDKKLYPNTARDEHGRNLLPKSQGEIYDAVQDSSKSKSSRKSSFGNYLNVAYRLFPDTPVFLLNQEQRTALGNAVRMQYPGAFGHTIVSVGNAIMRENSQYILDREVKDELLENKPQTRKTGPADDDLAPLPSSEFGGSKRRKKSESRKPRARQTRGFPEDIAPFMSGPEKDEWRNVTDENRKRVRNRISTAVRTREKMGPFSDESMGKKKPPLNLRVQGDPHAERAASESADASFAMPPVTQYPASQSYGALPLGQDSSQPASGVVPGLEGLDTILWREYNESVLGAATASDWGQSEVWQSERLLGGDEAYPESKLGQDSEFLSQGFSGNEGSSFSGVYSAVPSDTNAPWSQSGRDDTEDDSASVVDAVKSLYNYVQAYQRANYENSQIGRDAALAGAMAILVYPQNKRIAENTRKSLKQENNVNGVVTLEYFEEQTNKTYKVAPMKPPSYPQVPQSSSPTHADQGVEYMQDTYSSMLPPPIPQSGQLINPGTIWETRVYPQENRGETEEEDIPIDPQLLGGEYPDPSKLPEPRAYYSRQDAPTRVGEPWQHPTSEGGDGNFSDYPASQSTGTSGYDAFGEEHAFGSEDEFIDPRRLDDRQQGQRSGSMGPPARGHRSSAASREIILEEAGVRRSSQHSSAKGSNTGLKGLLFGPGVGRPGGRG